METGYVISDLHVFAGWSWGDRYLERMHEVADGADFFVLNGDIFTYTVVIAFSMIRNA